MGTFLTIVITAASTYFLVIVVRQFISQEKKIEHRIDSLYAPGDAQFYRSTSALFLSSFLEGNRITPLFNGDEIFPPMLDSIRSAEHTICFETFIYWGGNIGNEFADALAERARAGVNVHIVLDWLGSKKMDDELLEKMREAGCQLKRYHEPKWYHFRTANHRTHRKLLIVDGRLGFTGGVGIADEWTGHAQDSDHWRDTHYRVEGPIVARLQAAFMDNWLKTYARVLHGEKYFPNLESRGNTPVQLFVSSPDEGSESVRLMFLLALSAAQKSIRISTAYFVPDTLAIQTLVDARQRGVEIDIIVPGEHIDFNIVRRASRSRWGKLLEADIRIYEYLPTMYHNKVLILDELWVSIGSTNFDNRSFRLNDEANMNCIDADLAGQLVNAFEHDKTRSQQITCEMWKNRPMNEKIREKISSAVGSQL